MFSARFRSSLISLTIHAAGISLLLLASMQMTPPRSQVTALNFAPLLAPFYPRPHANVREPMSGGGGMRRSLPATAGHLPKIGPQFVPPARDVPALPPKVSMEITIEAAPDATLFDKPLAGIGDPLSALLNNSAGKGGPLGIGDGNGTGIGNKRAPGVGPGDGLTGTVYRAGNGVTVPVLIHHVEPEFSEEARKAKHSGTVSLRADIDSTGHPRNIRVVHSIGMGLDERAVHAVEQWLFKPGTKNGKPVAVTALVEVSFHLL